MMFMFPWESIRESLVPLQFTPIIRGMGFQLSFFSMEM